MYLRYQTVNSTANFNHVKEDTARVWAIYFSQVGFEHGFDISRDTSSYLLRDVKDTAMEVKTEMSDGSIVTKQQWKRDTFYYAPYDSLIRLRDTVKKKDTIMKVQVFLNIPKEWILFDFNKQVLPPKRK